MDNKLRFKDLNIGDKFDWIDDSRPGYNSFYLRCEKISQRKYRDENGVEHRVGSIGAYTHHVERVNAFCACGHLWTTHKTVHIPHKAILNVPQRNRYDLSLCVPVVNIPKLEKYMHLTREYTEMIGSAIYTHYRVLGMKRRGK